VTKTTTYTATLADRIILCSTAGGAWSLTLPAASGNTDKTYYVKKTTGDAYALTIDGNASETIDGSTTLALSTQYDSVLIACDGSNWHTLAQKDADLGTLSNVVEDATPQLGGFLDANGNYMQTEKGGDIASASPLVIDTDGDYFDVTGSTGFAAMTVVADRQFTLQFDGALTMTHHATNLDLPGESNITTAAGDVATFQSTGSNTVQCINYTRADGTAIVSSHTPEGTAVLSTGEGGGTKFLREDGDNSCSWQTAPVTSVSGSTGAVADGDIDHDSLANFAANEHYTQANITATGTVASGTWQGTAVDGAYVDIEGTEVKSTGEGAGTKFLREDGDGTCSWQAAAGGIASVAADGSPQLGGFLDANGNYMQTEKGGDLTSASPLVIDTDGDYFDVTGTTNFAAMTVVADRQFTLQFDGALTMTHHATNLDLPGEANITTAAGDVATFQSTGSNTVQCISYTRADGTAISGGSFSSAGRIYLNTQQNNLSSGSATKVLLDAESFDTGSEGDPDTNNQVDITDTGTYIVTAMLGWTNTVAGKSYRVQIYVNGAAVLRSQMQTATGTGDFEMPISGVVSITAGQKIELYANSMDDASTSDVAAGVTQTYLSWGRIA